MSALLWCLVVAAAVNTFSLLVCAATGGLPEAKPLARAADAAYTLAMGCWALWLLAKGGAA